MRNGTGVCKEQKMELYSACFVQLETNDGMLCRMNSDCQWWEVSIYFSKENKRTENNRISNFLA